MSAPLHPLRSTPLHALRSIPRCGHRIASRRRKLEKCGKFHHGFPAIPSPTLPTQTNVVNNNKALHQDTALYQWPTKQTVTKVMNCYRVSSQTGYIKSTQACHKNPERAPKTVVTWGQREYIGKYCLQYILFAWGSWKPPSTKGRYTPGSKTKRGSKLNLVGVSKELTRYQKKACGLHWGPWDIKLRNYRGSYRNESHIMTEIHAILWLSGRDDFEAGPD